jgi:hypothetical protein
MLQNVVALLIRNAGTNQPGTDMFRSRFNTPHYGDMRAKYSVVHNIIFPA